MYSMTGYGRAEGSVGKMKFLVELRSVNGKQFDLRLNIPQILKPYEFDIRKQVNLGLERGSVECIVTLESVGDHSPVGINQSLAKAYFEPIAALSKDLGLSTDNLLATILKFPDVMTSEISALSETEISIFKQLLQKAIDAINSHRMNEGAVLEKDILSRIDKIESIQPKIAVLADARKTTIRENLSKILGENVSADKFDANRMEQELIYYIEKIDINEEQVRLRNHCNYFRSITSEKEPIAKGKKLGFVLQEMGREINTTGSKAYNADIQQLVVIMKDELEKAKEQILNVL